MATTTTPTTIEKLYTTTTHSAYNVNCFNHQVRTIVTRNPTIVTSWISHIRSNHQLATIVGLDTEWRNPVATLQLCVGPNCLIYQLLNSLPAPPSLTDFLRDPRLRFTGVSVAEDAKRLAEDHGLTVETVVDVSRVAAEAGRVRKNAGLREVAKAVLGWEVEKNKNVTMSRWDRETLDEEQIKYACIDAFVSYYIARVLIGVGSYDDEINDNKFFEELGDLDH